MEWTELNIFTTTEGIDLICSRLMDIGIKGFAIKDAEDFNEFLENKNGKWDYIDEDLLGLSNCETCITIYLPNNNQGAEMLISVNAMLKEMKAEDTKNIFGRLETEFSNIREEDWANNWKQYFKPLKIGEKLIITLMVIIELYSKSTLHPASVQVSITLQDSALSFLNNPFGKMMCCLIWVAEAVYFQLAQCFSVQKALLLST